MDAWVIAKGILVGGLLLISVILMVAAGFCFVLGRYYKQ